MKSIIKIKFVSAFVSNSVRSVHFDSVVPTPSPFGPICDCSISRLPRRSIVVKPSSNPSDSGSALILTLLITALLTTVAVSFLSTSRVEQIAARNFSRQNAASGLAESATQMAMGKIQQGFTVNGTGTTVISTQPGSIRQFRFSGGNCSLVAQKDLFSGSGNATTNATANLNNLQNPSSNATFTSNSSNNQWTITGNASEAINIPMEEITSNGTLIGRIAYYVDDEGTKLNLNAATGNRTTLNIGSSRSQSLSSFANETLSDNFTDIISGCFTASNSTKTWNYFFRPEQLGAALIGNNSSTAPAAITGNLSKFSAAPAQVDPAKIRTNSTSRDYHLKRTPWGTSRLFINDLPINSTGVAAISNALSDSRLRDIYGSTFADKYTAEGLNQIAANLLQARHANTLNNWNKSFPYNGALLGAANATSDLVAIANCCINTSKAIPKDYLGSAPYPFINEIGVTVVWACDFVSQNPTVGGPRPPPGKWLVRPSIRPYISIVNLNNTEFSQQQVAEWEIQMQVDSFRYDFTCDGLTFTYGPKGFKDNDSWGHDFIESESNGQTRDSGAPPGKLRGNYVLGSGPLIYRLKGYSKIGTNENTIAADAPGYSASLAPGEELQFPCPPYPGRSWSVAFLVSVPFAGGNVIPEVELGEMVIKFEYIRLLAKSGDGTTIRDWVLGEDLGPITCYLQKPHPTGGWASGQPGKLNRNVLDGSYKDLFDDDGDGKKWEPDEDEISIPNFRTTPVNRSLTKPPATSVKRIDGRLRTPATMAATGPLRNSMKAWSLSSAQSWPDPSASEKAKAANKDDAKAFPYETRGNEIPGDPIENQNTKLSSAYDPASHHLDSNDWPSIQFTNPANGSGVLTSPADLGKIQTNVQHRKLRMATQHPNEVKTADGGTGTQTFIPDWAMLDVISFGSNATNVPAPGPVNLNGQFHVPATSPQPAPRTAALKATLKALDSAALVGNTFNPAITFTVNKTQYAAATVNSSAMADNIGNLIWTTGNFTSGNATWAKRRNIAKFPSDQIVLPAEVTEIKSISDFPGLDTYTGNTRNIKGNEGPLGSLFPGATTQSRFFTIYAYAQALDKNGSANAESVMKTLVEVVEDSTAIPSTFKVKKLYEQQIKTK